MGRITVAAAAGRIRVLADGVAVADSTRALVLDERGLPPVY